MSRDRVTISVKFYLIRLRVIVNVNGWCHCVS